MNHLCYHGKRRDQFCLQDSCHRGQLVLSEKFARALLRFLDDSRTDIGIYATPLLWPWEDPEDNPDKIEDVQKEIDWSTPLCRFAFSDESMARHKEYGDKVPTRQGWIKIYVPYRKPTHDEMRAYRQAMQHFLAGYEAAGKKAFVEKDPNWLQARPDGQESS